MKTTWDYTDLASAYMKRPDYADEAITRLLAIAQAGPGTLACDVGAGTGHLTKALVAHGLSVTAVEPNDAMRALGRQVTQGQAATWSEGTGEATAQPAGRFGLVTFGSSFNTTDRPAALAETARILAPAGWFACLWNHRDLTEPLQDAVEAKIHAMVADYAYGTRREDQTAVIDASGLFGPVVPFEGSYVATVSRDSYLEAWRSHATLQRQAGERFTAVVAAIEEVLGDRPSLEVPYTTRGWMARKR